MAGAVSVRSEEYLLDAGDEIQIQVYQEADLTMKVRLDRSGVINYPYLGQIEVRGKSAAQLQAEIDAGLRGDVRAAQRERFHHDLSELLHWRRNPKARWLRIRTRLTIRQALNLAGGMTEFGSTARIEIQRKGRRRPLPLTSIAAFGLEIRSRSETACFEPFASALE